MLTETIELFKSEQVFLLNFFIFLLIVSFNDLFNFI